MFPSLALTTLLVLSSEAFMSSTIRSQVTMMKQSSTLQSQRGKGFQLFVNLHNSTAEEYLVKPGQQNNTISQKLKTQIENMKPSEVLVTDVKKDKVVEKSRTAGQKTEEKYKLNEEHSKVLAEVANAQEEFLKLSQEDTNRVFQAVAQAANLERLPLAKLAREETKMGCFEDKVLKNGLACELIYDRYYDAKTCGLIHEDYFHGIKTYAYPVGPIAALTPVTNPTSTAIAKCLIMAKTRNAGVFLPHPRASKATAEAVRICCEAGEKAGAPKGWVRCIEQPTMEESNAIMRSNEIRLILSTGGPGVVKASYTSGKPAIGVGAGNAPVLVDETANLPLACGSIIMGKTFDNGMICAAEQSAVVVKDVYQEFKKLLEDRGVHFLEGKDREHLANYMRKDGRINPDIVGQSALDIAEKAGIQNVPKDTLVLATEEDRNAIGEEYPMSHEKLSPVLSLFQAENFEDGVDLCAKLTKNGGVGHTAGLYTSKNSTLASEREKLFVQSVPVSRVLVNSPTSLTAIGTSFNFDVDPSFTLGVGTMAGSSVSQNVGPSHLINIVTVAERQDHIEWFNLPQRVFFNRGCLEEALRECGKAYSTGERDERVIIISGKTNKKLGYVDRVSRCLRGQGFEVETFTDVHADPDMECIRKGVEACTRFNPDLMICLGGGSPLDAGKFIRAQYEHPELTLEQAASRFIELRKRTIEFPKLGSKIRRLVAIPTTSGTGSEVSPFTVITDDNGRKFPIASYKLTPDIAICDSTLCDTIPRSLVANAGIDAITHAIESYVSVAQNDFTKMHSLEALELLFGNLRESYDSGSTDARDAVHRGATVAGIAFSNAFLGVCHSLAHKVGAKFHLPHGLTNGILLPHVIRYNASKKPTRMGIFPSYSHPMSIERYSEIAEHIGAPSNDPEGLIKMIECMMIDLDMPLSFKDANVPMDEFMAALDEMAENAFDDQCTPANPRYPMVHELKDVLINAFYGST